MNKGKSKAEFNAALKRTYGFTLEELEAMKSEVGYHLSPIEKGTFGEASKIIEEAKEFEDALVQDCPLMAIHELSDLIGAIDGWLTKYHPSLTLNDLIKMSEITQRAFKNGHRT